MSRDLQRSQSPQAYAKLLSSAAKNGELPILVGGQAVNLWALLFLEQEAELKEFLPFTSKDCDVVATTAWLLEIAKKYKLPYRTFKAGQASPAAGCIRLPMGGKSEIELQVLRDVLGLTREAVEAATIEVDFENMTLQVLDPVTLLKAKIANLYSLPQKDRYDFPHVQILIRCVRAALNLQVSLVDQGEITPRQCIAAFEAVLRLITSETAKHVALKFGIDFKRVFPMDAISARKEPPFQNFVQKRIQNL